MALGDRATSTRDPHARGLSRSLNRAHDDFLATGRVEGLRQVVVESWQRSLLGGLDPEHALAPITLDQPALEDIRSNHPLSAAMPVIRRLLVDSAADAGLLVAVSDSAGQLLWVEGSDDLRSRAEAMHFMAGANWSEACAGTNAPGTALALDRSMQILGAEHLVRHVTPWSCTAAPIHEPDTGAVLGVLDLTGGAEVVTAQTLSLVRATVAAVEAELRLERLQPRPQQHQHRGVALGWTAPPRLDVLGRRGARLSRHDAVTTLSRRHSELLLLLALSDGMTADELAVGLSENDQPSVTVRAEMSRLRPLLGTVPLRSRPYRLDRSVTTDIAVVRSELEAGRVRKAVACYPGPVLPYSTAPAVEAIRAELHGLVRSALLASGDVDALLSFADTDHGRQDLDIWRAALDALPAWSPRHAQVRGHVNRLDRELA